MQVFNNLFKNPLFKTKTNTLKGKKTKGKPSIRPKIIEKTLSTLTNLTEILPLSILLAASVNHRCFNWFSAWRRRQSLNPNSGMWEPTLERFRASVVLKSSMELDVGREAAGSPPQKRKGTERLSVCITTFYLHFFGVAKKDVRFQRGVIFFLNKSDLDLI